MYFAFIIVIALLAGYMFPIIVFGFNWAELITLANADKTSKLAIDFLEKIGRPLDFDNFHQLVNDKIGVSAAAIWIIAIIAIIIAKIIENKINKSKKENPTYKNTFKNTGES